MIYAYNGYTSNDYTKMGLGILSPISCTVTEKAGGSYELEMEHPIDPEGKWEWLSTGNIIKAPCPVYDVGSTMMGTNAQVWKTTSATSLYSQPDAPTRITYSQWVISTDYDQGSKVTYSGQNYQSTQVLMDHERHIAPPQLPSKWAKIQNYTSGSSVVASVAANAECYVLSSYSTGWNYVRMMTGEEGYLQTSKSTYVRTETRQPVDPRVVTEQCFRIYKTEINTAQTRIKVNAQHVSYDLSGTLLGSCQIGKLTPAGAVARIRSTMLAPAQCTIATNLPDTAEPFTADFSYKNPVYALLDPKEGIVPFYNAMLVRDDWDFFILENEATDRGFSLTYGVNLRGVTWKSDTQKVVTRIIPIAKQADDSDLLLPEVNVDSIYIDSYPTPLAQSMSIDGKVGGDDGQGGTWTEQTLLQYMRDQARSQFDTGCDLPTEDITVEFQMLGDTVEYAQYKKLEKLYLYDTVTVLHPEIGLNRKLQVSETRWDAIRETFEAITLSSSLEYNGITIAGFQIASGTLTAKNLGRSSVGMDQLASGAVNGDKIEAGAIVAGKIAAGAVTAVAIAANAVEADKIKAGAVNADKIAAGAVEAGKIAAGAVTTNKLAAGAVTAAKIGAGEVTAAKLNADVAEFVNTKISSANIGYAQIKDADIQNLITKDAIADRYYIEKLQVQNLQVLHQTVDNLVVKAANGNYYSLDISDAGVVTPTQVTVTTSEINAGVTSSGRSIIETDLLVTDLAASNIKGANALIDRITAARLDVGELFARQATIDQLQTVDISSNTSLQVQAQNQIDLTVGKLNINGTNLLTDGDTPADNDGTGSNTFIKKWTMLEDLVTGQDYTLTVRLTPGANISYYNVYAAYFSGTNRTYIGRVTPTGTSAQTLQLQFTFSGYNEGVGQRSTLAFARAPVDSPGATAITWAKLEKGIESSEEYTPPPSTEPNMLYGGDEVITASTYNVHTWQADDMVAGQRYTITACLEAASDASAYRLYTNGSGVALGNLSSITTANDGMPIVASLSFVFAGYSTSTNPDNHGIRMYRRLDTATGTTKVHWIEMHKGVGRQVWSPNPNEINNSGIKITNEGIDIYTGGKLNMSGQTEGSLLLPNGTVSALNGNFTNLSINGNQIGAGTFLMPVACKFTQGQSSAPAGHGFLWFNASGSSYSSASRSGTTDVGYLPRTYTLNAPTNTLPSGTFEYTLTFGVVNRQNSNPSSISFAVTATISSVTFTSSTITLSKWQTQQVSITVTSTTNLFSSTGTLSVAFSSNWSGTTGLGPDLDGSGMTLTAQVSGTSGTQTVTVKYVP